MHFFLLYYSVASICYCEISLVEPYQLRYDWFLYRAEQIYIESRNLPVAHKFSLRVAFLESTDALICHILNFLFSWTWKFDFGD